MNATLHKFSQPTTEPISLLEAKVMLALAVDLEDAGTITELDTEVMAAIVGARNTAEIETGKTLVYTGYELYLNRWPVRGRCIDLLAPPVLLIESVTYWLQDGTEVSFTEWTGDVRAFSPKVVLNTGASWPDTPLREVDAIRVRYRAGMVVPFSINAETGVLTVTGNPFSDGDTIRLSVSGGALPGGLIVKRDYFVRDSSGDTFSLAETIGGTALAVTDSGSGLLFIGEIEGPAMVGFRMIATGLFENIRDSSQTTHDKYIKAASHWFRMDSARGV